MAGVRRAGTVLWSLAVVAMSAPAWAGSWTALGRDAARTASTTDTLGQPLTEAWKIALKSNPLSSVTSDGNRVFVGTDQGLLLAFDIATGKSLWSFKAGDRIYSTPAVDGTSVYFGSYDRNLYALDARTGRMLWKYASGGNEMSSPIVSGSVVYMGSGFPNRRIMAVRTDGKLLWDSKLGQMSYSSPALSGGNLLIAANDGVLSAFDATSGASLWKKQTKGQVMLSSPTVTDGGTVLFAPGGEDTTLYAYSLSGKDQWTRALVSIPKGAPSRMATVVDVIPACEDPMENQRLGGECERQKAARRAAAKAPSRAAAAETANEEYSAPAATSILVSHFALGANAAYALVTHGLQRLMAFSVSDGSVLWSVDAGIPSTPAFSSSPVLAGNLLYVGTGNGELVAARASDGTVLQRVTLDGSINSSAAVAGNRLLIATGAGSLYAFK